MANRGNVNNPANKITLALCDHDKLGDRVFEAVPVVHKDLPLNSIMSAECGEGSPGMRYKTRSSCH